MNRNLFLVFAIGLLPVMAHGHGSMQDPISRVYSIYLENPENPVSDAGKAAVAVNGTQPFYDWHEVSRNIPDYNWQAAVPDGQLASGGRTKYAGLDLVRSDWPATAVEPGPYHFVYHAHVPHDPSFFRAYITRADWDPNTPLAWDDLVMLPGTDNVVGSGNYYTWDTVLPEREGRHVIYVIWQRIDPVGEVFFSVSDVVFGEDNGTGGPVNPGGGTGGGGHDHGDHDHGDGSNGSSANLKVEVASSWYNGFSANITLSNPGPAPINGWTLEFDYPHNITSQWSALLKSRTGQRYTFGNESWNGAIPAGGQVTFGIQAEGDGSGVPQNVLLNGSPLGGSGGGHDHGGGDHGGGPGDDDGDGHDHGDPGNVPGDDDGDCGASFEADFVVTSDWGSGFNGDITITNNNQPAGTSWTLEFDFDRVISSIWNAEVASRTGTRYVIRNAPWNGALAAGASVSFGFTAGPGNVGGSQPANWVFNGKSTCQCDDDDGDDHDHGDTGGGGEEPPPPPVVPVLNVGDIAVEEGDSGQHDAVFVLTLSEPTTISTSVHAHTMDGTALAGQDYMARSVHVSFAPGQTTAQVAVAILGNTLHEADKAFTLMLSSPQGLTLARSSATATILNDDPVPPPPPPPDEEPGDNNGGGDDNDVGEPPAPATFQASFTATSDWGSGFNGDIAITNLSDAVSGGWTLEFDFDRVVSAIWNAEVVSRTGTRYVVKNAPWNGNLAAGESVTFGFSAAPGNLNGAQPSNWVFNGVAAGGSTPPEDPGDGGSGDSGGNDDSGSGDNPGDGDNDGNNNGGGDDNTDPDDGDTGGGSPGDGNPGDGGGNHNPPTGEKRNVAYFPGWGIYQKGYEVAHLPADKLTHVIHAFARISPAGEIEIIDPWADIERPVGPDTWDTPLRGHYGAYARLKAEHPHLRVLIAVGGWFDSGRFSDVAASPAARVKFAKSVRAFCVQYGFDGVDLDWEYPVVATDVNSNVRPADGENYALLAQAIRAEFDAQQAIDGRYYEITAATPAGFDKFERINLAALAAQLDFINLMTYDFHGRWIANQTGHNAPLFRSAGDPNPRYNTDEAVRGYIAAGVPSDKILLGIPAYGYGWQGVGSATPFSPAAGVGPGTLSIEPGFYDYRTVADLVRANPSAERWDEQAQASYYYDGNLWIGYDSPRAVRRKLQYVEEMNLGGVMFWEAATDIRNHDDPDCLMNIVYQEL